ncbi:MAG: DUF5666 domain-containing protein [Candidatus Peregrinibacteria bacterium]|nr:DUF5666 domain-containing protein [Candidatus Peregrinibacteria bacterium]
MMKKNLSWIVALVVVAGVAFYGGNLYGQNQAAAARKTAQGQFGGGAGRRGGMGGNGAGLVSGSIFSKDDKSITVTLRDGSSKIIFYSPTTTVGKMAQGSASDLVTGEQVSVVGKTNDDGTVTAQSIQLRPPMPADATSIAPKSVK